MVTEIELANISKDYSINNIENEKYKYLQKYPINDFNIENYVNINIYPYKNFYNIHMTLKNTIYNKIEFGCIYSNINNKVIYNKKISKKHFLEMNRINNYNFYINDLKQDNIKIILLLKSNNNDYLDIELRQEHKIDLNHK